MAENVPDVYVRLHGLKGECTDETHPGEDGWVQIRGFSFSFGLKDSSSKAPKVQVRKGMSVEELQKAHEEADRQKEKAAKKKDDGPFDRPEVNLNKTLDLASPSIWKQKCHSGESIPKVEIVACRYGGEQGDEKIPFVTLIFENVKIKSVSMGISADELPSESIRFHYDAVKLKYIWTANDRGSRVRGAAAPRAGWNFEDNQPVEWADNE